jgi:glycosyltransferase involved in cell wall biosynthesis
MNNDTMIFPVDSDRREVVLLNDSFPPLIDGVSTAVMNYASGLIGRGWDASVVVPEYPGADDSSFRYPVIRYPSIDIRKLTGYTAGNPFSLAVQERLKGHKVALIHSHCPFASNMVARELRARFDAPLVLTYHTKFDRDIANIIRSEPLRRLAVRVLVESVSAADELWVVSDGAGRNICDLGYAGSYTVMPNGVDLPRGRAPEADVAAVCGDLDLPADVPLFLFVGRLMWYKGLRLILEALAALRSRDLPFRAVFIGSGREEAEIRELSDSLGLAPYCVFTGPVRDRKALAAWYTRADLFLFPSTFDTNGLVVREAAACGLASVLIRGSCAAEGVTDGVNALLADETSASLAVCLASVMKDRDYLRGLGERACADLYRSWDDAVAEAAERYETVIDNWKSGRYSRKRRLSESLYELQANYLDVRDRFGPEKIAAAFRSLR